MAVATGSPSNPDEKLYVGDRSGTIGKEKKRRNTPIYASQP